MMFAQTLVSKEKEKVSYIGNEPHLKHCKLPIVTYFEDGEHIAECPLFYVSSHGNTEAEALERVKEALELYLTENMDSISPSEMEYTKEEVIQKAKDLFLEFSAPGEEIPEYKYQEIEICIK